MQKPSIKNLHPLKSSKESKVYKNNRPHIMSFGVVVILMSILYVKEHIYPFGDNTFLRMDFYHQYFPFMTQFYDTVHSGGSFLFSWQNGMGINFFPIFAYYLASPFNLIMLIVPRAHLLEAMQVMLVLKGGMAAFFMSKSLSLRYRHNDLYTIFFGAFYGLSAYYLSYICNPIWLDMFMLTPLIMLGVWRIANGKSGKLYGITMGIATFSNFYLAVIGGICCVLYLIVCLIASKKVNFKAAIKAIVKFVAVTILYVCICAVILIPSAMALMNVPDAEQTFPESFALLYQVYEGFTRFLINVETVQNGSSLPNVYCSICAIIMLPLYFANKRIAIRKKIPLAILLVFMFISFEFNVLDYIWHGFHYPNCFPARQSFFICFLLVTMAYECFARRKHIPLWAVIAMPSVMITVLIVSNFLVKNIEDPIAVYGLSALVMTLYTIVLILDRLIGRKKVFVLFGCVALLELTCNTLVTGMNSTVNREDYIKDNEYMESLIGALPNQFIRVEELDRKTINDAALYGYNSVSVFSSTLNQGVKEFFYGMGLRQSNVAYSYQGSNPLMSSMLGINYILCKDDLSPSMTYEKIAEDEETGIRVWKNTEALSIGYMVDDDLSEYEFSKADNPFDSYNNLVRQILGNNRIKLFNPIIKRATNSRTEEALAEGIEKATKGKNVNVQPIMFDIEAGDHAFIYLKTYTDSIKVTTIIDGEEPTEKVIDDLQYKQIIDMRISDKDRTIIIVPTDNNIAVINFLAYTFSYDVYELAMEELSKEQLSIDKIDDGYLKGHINVEEDNENLLLSIPYDEGWSVYVDGNKVSKEAFKDAFIMIPVSKGEHEIEMRFVPKGFMAGVIVSIVGLMILTAIFIKNIQKKHKIKA